MKEYYLGDLKFEGEYLNGKRNGKGKEYYGSGDLLFEGEYLDGKRWNGQGYDKHGKKQYEIKEGKGYVKEYNDFNGNLDFEGEYKNGERNGRGKEYSGGSEYPPNFEGEYLNGKRNGKGEEYYDNGYLLFKGEYLNGQRNGKGEEYLWYGYGTTSFLIFKG